MFQAVASSVPLTATLIALAVAQRLTHGLSGRKVSMVTRLSNGLTNMEKEKVRSRQKYGNSKVEYDGITFDSKRERDRYIVLKDAAAKGIITDLQCQPKWELLPTMYKEVVIHLKTKDKIVQQVDQKSVTYKADFSYIKNGELVVEDVKISEYLLPKEFILKEKMMYYFHHIRIKRIYKPTEAL